MGKVDHEASTRHANWVSQTDSTTMHIDFGRVDSQHLDVCQDNDAESLVNLPESNVLDFDSGIGQQLLKKIKILVYSFGYFLLNLHGGWQKQGQWGSQLVQ